jgi:nitrogen fixation/metabolism regulation signal transduction histidine kinase
VNLRARLLLGFLALSLVPTLVLTTLMLEQIDQAHRVLVHSPGVEQALESALVVSKITMGRAEATLHGLAADWARLLDPGPLGAAQRSALAATLRSTGADFAQLYRLEGGAWRLVEEVNAPGVLTAEPADLSADLAGALAGDGTVRSTRGALAAVASIGREWLVLFGDRVPPDFFQRVAQAGEGASIYRRIGAYSKVWRGVLLVWALALSLGLALVAAWLATRLSDQLTRPVAELVAALERVAGGDLQVRVRAAGAREIKQLGGSFNQMAERLAQARAELGRAERKAAWGGIAAGVAHEIRNALTPMGSSLHLLRKRVDSVDAEQRPTVRENLDALSAEVEGLTRLAEEFSDLGRLPEPRTAALDLAALARKAATLHARAGYDLAVDAPPGAVWVQGDDLLLGRVLHNLVINACEAMPTGGRVVIRVKAADGGASLEVQDTGSGIPAELRARVLERDVSTKQRGSGLGLAFSRDVVELHGGRLELESEPDRGTTARVVLPPGPPPPGASGKESAA